MHEGFDQDLAASEERAILVLGAAVWPGGRPSPTLLRRTLHAAHLWHEGTARAIVPCGGTGRTPPSEAEVMRRILLDTGVPDRAIHPEDRSASTAENIRFAKPILAALDISSVLIVSDVYHLPRARLLARREGFRRIETSAPPLRGARLTAQLKGVGREVAAYLAALLRLTR